MPEAFFLPVTGRLGVSDFLDDFCNVFVNVIGHEYQPRDDEAVPNVDFTSDLLMPREFLLSTSFVSVEFELLETIDNLECGDDDKGTGFEVTLNNSPGECPADIVIDDFRELFDIKIEDDDIKSFTVNLLEDGAIDIAPTITTNSFTLNSENHTISSLRLIDKGGRIVKIIENIDSSNITVDLNDLRYQGVIIVQVFTGSGEISIKKILHNNQ